MEIVEFKEYAPKEDSIAIALGNFDGLHIGHQELIKKVVSQAKEKKMLPSVLLFKEHTRKVINNKKPKMLTNNEQKYEILSSMGIEKVFAIEFNEELMKLSPEDFVKNILVDGLNVKLVVVGFDYKFGYKASGNLETLKELGKINGIEVIVIEPIEEEDIIIGSSIIRKLINDGDVKAAISILGRPYTIVGKVIPGMNRGNKLGFPTANMRITEDFAMPVEGVYKTNTIINGKRYLSATNIGVNPTFNENELKIETHILDFKGDIYDQEISIEFLDFIREDIKFNNKEELIDQINKDIEIIRAK